MVSIFSEYVENFIKVVMDDFSVYGNYFDLCLANLELVFKCCLETNLVLNWKKCHFISEQLLTLGNLPLGMLT